jgi:hypothetical protein
MVSNADPSLNFHALFLMHVKKRVIGNRIKITWHKIRFRPASIFMTQS